MRTTTEIKIAESTKRLSIYGKPFLLSSKYNHQKFLFRWIKAA